jgi:aerobic-type carbon monoxide dehydrogenase small subunit (CoxS/CutS family)
MGAAYSTSNRLSIFTMQGILQWDLEKNAQCNFLPSESVVCGDAREGMICTAHDKTVMVWDDRTITPVNLILAHSM